MLHCFPVGMIGEDAAGTGTVMRAGTMRRYANEAGFTDFEVLPIESDFYRFLSARSLMDRHVGRDCRRGSACPWRAKAGAWG
jgi:hypothetical protein